MRMHPVISILLAAWFGLGSSLGPRFLCLCADGTVTVEIGHRFCSDSDDSCCDSCDGSATTDEEPCDVATDTWACSGGCESELISDDFIGKSGRISESDLVTTSSTVHPGYAAVDKSRWTSSIGMMGIARIPDSRATRISQLRSVILLV